MNALERMLADAPGDGERRNAAAAALRAHGLPGPRDEHWRHAPLRALESVAGFRNAARSPAAPLPPALLPGATRFVFEGGHCTVPKLPAGVGAAATGDAAAGGFELQGDGRLGLLARLQSPQPLALAIAGEQALELCFIAAGAATASYTDVDISVAAGASLRLIERQLGGGDGALACTRLCVRLGEGARLEHLRLQTLADGTLHFDTTMVDAGPAASHRLVQVSAGAAHSRSSIEVRLAGASAATTVHAAAVTGGEQSADLLLRVLHDAPGTAATQLYRAVAAGHSRASCAADTQVGPGARGAAVAQSLRGLIDGRGAGVNLSPWLTILTDEVQATHGATTGQLDEARLFYLLSRGLGADEARALLKWAFLGEAIAGLAPPELAAAARRCVAARLADAPPPELLQ